MYTNNNCLPQYFFGDKMNQDEQITKNILNISEDVHLSEPNLSSIPSPSSSLASTKKLEWDSGADIGYIYDSVKHHRKSKSYPSLNMDPKKPQQRSPTATGVENIHPLTSIGEGDTLKSQRNKKPKTFKHSTPLDYKRALKSSGDWQHEKATSPISPCELRDECLQTTLIHRSSKEVQTENISDAKNNEDKSLQTDITDILGAKSMSSSSKSGSFKYIPGSEIEYINSNSNSSTIKSGVSLKSSSYSASSHKNETETDSGSCSPLGQMISTQHSKNLIADIDKSLDILQKFITSKNYSNDTKKHYAKKIVTKIINNRYSEDTESSLDIKTPPLKERQYVECGVQCDEIHKKSQIITDKSNCKIKESLEKLNALQTDLKNWRDAQTLSEKLFEARKSHKTPRTVTPEHNASSNENSKRDYLVQHSKKERKRQISWINNEISYLQKLKDLLQIKEQSNISTSTNTSTSQSTSTTTKTQSILRNKLKSYHEIQNLKDIEKKFNEEFGICPVNANDNKLSKYLSNEQIKSILDHEVHKKVDIENNISYNSHKNSIYGDGDRTRQIVSKRTQQTSSSDLNVNVNMNPIVNAIVKTSLPVDAATQYSNRTNTDPDPDPDPSSYEANIESNSTTSEYDESVIIERQQEVAPKSKINKGGTAYFLTFEEESQSDFDVEKRNILEQVVVKIPKYRSTTTQRTRTRNNNSVSVKNEACARTLEEYLIENRPNFVRSANWRWTQVRSLDLQPKQNLFTCHEMKEMSKRKYNKLPEIQEKANNYKTLIERKHNRFMANIFSKKLQKKTLQGHICLPTCRNVIASD